MYSLVVAGFAFILFLCSRGFPRFVVFLFLGFKSVLVTVWLVIA